MHGGRCDPGAVETVTRGGLEALDQRIEQARGERPVQRIHRRIHVDVKKLGRLRDGGGWRIHGHDSIERRRARYRPRVATEPGAAQSLCGPHCRSQLWTGMPAQRAVCLPEMRIGLWL
ncbi:hypothetical protein GCM10010169_35590 [Micromonospora fulviviridis]|nr:hypothetical protein GCM10010169_35590 [Micromonospora fulviviridis]